jgi:hypothetical protein
MREFLAEDIRKGESRKVGKGAVLKTFEETQEAWSDKNHPELKTAKDMERFIKKKRHSYRKRVKKIMNTIPSQR